MKDIVFFDSTLRDGAQGEGISFTVNDKLNIVRALDELGIRYIEAGNPGSNPKDLEFFEKVKAMTLKNSCLVAFGSTRRRDIKVEDDQNVRSLLTADTPAVAIFGKTWDLHVTEIIKTTLDENLRMITETLSFFTRAGKEIIFDAEHFFDGFKANPDYALSALEAAVTGGASTLALCDTNGGTQPDEIVSIVNAVKKRFPDITLGIHCHNDCGMAVANSVLSVEAGVTHVQGTFLGFGERCGNANLSTILCDLQQKRGYACIPQENMQHVTQTARLISSIANIILENSMPFVGASAFAHKGGMHIDGVNKLPHSFEHIEPASVGNERRFLMSEVSGRSLILKKIRALAPNLEKDSPETVAIMEKLKEQEHKGYQYEAAEASFELLVMKELGQFSPYFTLAYFKTLGERISNLSALPATTSTAIIKILVKDEEEVTAAEGKGPVNALDNALRRALIKFYPQLDIVRLTDYRVRVMEAQDATASKIRVLIESTDGVHTWTTVGISTDIIGASWKALSDSMEYKLVLDNKKS